jgi:hypothetical protein
MTTINPLIVSGCAIVAAVAILSLPMPRYIRNSIAIISAWFGISYAIIYFWSFDLPSVSLLVRFNLILLFLVIIACAIAWHLGVIWKQR